eukprot:COSAG06_NODE_13118_length_1290_cov_0.985738_1_plen_139_part_10
MRLIAVSKLWMAALALPLLLHVLLLLLPADCTGAPPPSPPLPLVKPCSVAGMKFCDPSLPVEERAANLVAELTLEEKIAQLSTYSFAKKYRHRYTPPVPRPVVTPLARLASGVTTGGDRGGGGGSTGGGGRVRLRGGDT